MYSKIKLSRNILSFILVLICFCFSCKNHQLEQLQGIWIGAHRGDTSNLIPNNVMLQVTGKRATFILFAFPGEGSDEVHELDITIKSKEIIFRDGKEEVFKLESENKDSLSLRALFGSKEQFIFKKAPAVLLKQPLSTSYFQNSAFSFCLESSNLIDTIDFITEVKFVKRNERDKYLNRWYLKEVAGFQFLIFGALDHYPYLILSEIEGKLEMEHYYGQTKHFKVKKIESQPVENLLTGHWEENILPEDFPPVPPMAPGMENSDLRLKLFFKADSITITEFGKNSKFKIKMSPFGDYIFFPDASNWNNLWEIKEISEHRIKIHKPWLDFTESARDFILERQ